jgi:hypothetical protein
MPPHFLLKLETGADLTARIVAEGIAWKMKNAYQSMHSSLKHSRIRMLCSVPVLDITQRAT